MTANKKSPTGDAAPLGAMPEIPEAVATVQFRHGRIVAGHVYMDLPMVPIYTKAQVAADRRACYLAGIAAARECVPNFQTEMENERDDLAFGFNRCRETTLANLEALFEGVAKGPALERTASGANFPKKEEAKK